MSRHFKNTLFSGIDNVVLVALGLLVTPILIKQFGVAGYGAYVFFSMFSVYGALSFFDFGLEGSIVTYVARYDADNDSSRVKEIFVLALLYYGAVGFVVGLSVFFVLEFFAYQNISGIDSLGLEVVSSSIKIVSLNFFFQFMLIPFYSVLNGLRKYYISKSVNFVGNIFQYLIVVFVSIVFVRVDIAFLVVALVSILRFVFYLVYFWKYIDFFDDICLKINSGIAGDLFKFSSLLFVSRIIGLVFNQMDKILVSAFLTISNLAILAIVAKPAALLRLILTVLNSSLIPEISYCCKSGESAKVRDLYVNMIRYGYILMVPILIYVFMNAERLIDLWVGTTLSLHSGLCLILLVGMLVSPISSISSTVVVGLERVRQTLWISVSGTVVNIVVSISLVQYLGLKGLLLGTLCADLFMFVPYLLVMTKIIGIKMNDVVAPIGKILLFGLPFLLFHEVGRHLPINGSMIFATVGLPLLALHFYFNLRFLLTDVERSYLVSRFKGGGKRFQLFGV